MRWKVLTPTRAMLRTRPFAHDLCSTARVRRAVMRPALSIKRLHMPNAEQPSRPPLVLVTHDEEWSVRSLDSILGPNGYAVLRAYTGRQALELARETQPDAVIVDLKLPDMTGLEVCRTLRSDLRAGLSTPIMVTTASSLSRAEVAEVLAAGAWELCSQPLDGEMLLLKLATFVRAKREVDRVHDESLVDDATGLYSFRGLSQRAREIGADVQRRKAALACLAFTPDLDAAEVEKSLLDDIARRVAAHLGQVCRQCGRGSDAIGRLGQSDFAIIAPATERDGALRLINRLQERLEATPLTFDGRSQRVKIRAGYSAVPNYAEAHIDVVELLFRAAAALRHSRSSGPQSAITCFDDVAVNQLH